MHVISIWKKNGNDILKSVGGPYDVIIFLGKILSKSFVQTLFKNVLILLR